MKLSLGLFVILTLCACTSKMQKWKQDVESFIATSDSTSYILNKQIDSTELTQLLESAAVCWSEAKSQFISDTLSIETLHLLDAFNVDYSNSKNLAAEYSLCKSAVKAQKERLILLQTDIQNGSGDRSVYCASIQKEKDELTIIRTHAIDIHRRFEELKISLEQFQPLLAR